MNALAPRLFFALWPEPEFVSKLESALDGAVEASGGRAVRLEGLHATLAFLGSVQRERLNSLMECVAAAARRAELGRSAE